MFSLVLGGNKSGKTDAGLDMLKHEQGRCCLVVTGKARDIEFNDQIMRHRQSRDPGIRVMEAGRDLGGCLDSLCPAVDAVLIDSLDFWVFNVFSRDCRQTYVDAFFYSLDAWRGKRLIVVSAEIGLGPVPCSADVRRFSRLLGEINQRLAMLCDEVILVVAGLPVTIKGSGLPG